MITYMRNEPKTEKTVALCHYQKHYGYLSAKMMKQHNCLGKNCPYLEKMEEHTYWEQRAARQELRRERKDRLAVEPQQGVKKESRIGIARTYEKSVYQDNEPVNNAFSGISGLLDMSGTCTAYSVICLSHSANQYGERAPFPIVESTETYYSVGDALAGTMRRNQQKTSGEPETDYLFIENANGERHGYRIDHQNKKYHEIDLNWGYLYPIMSRKLWGAA